MSAGNFLQDTARTLEVTVSSGTWTSLTPVGLNDRRVLTIQNQSDNLVKLSFQNTGPFVGVTLNCGESRFYNITEDIQIFAQSENGPSTLIVEEIS